MFISIYNYIYIWFSIVFVDLPFSSRVSYGGLKSSVSSYTRRRTCSRAYCLGYVVVCLLLPSSFMGMHIFCMCVCVHPQLFLGKCQDSMQSCAPYVYRRYLFNMVQLQLYNITRKRLQNMIKPYKTNTFYLVLYIPTASRNLQLGSRLAPCRA